MGEAGIRLRPRAERAVSCADYDGLLLQADYGVFACPYVPIWDVRPLCIYFSPCRTSFAGTREA